MILLACLDLFSDVVCFCSRIVRVVKATSPAIIMQSFVVSAHSPSFADV